MNNEPIQAYAIFDKAQLKAMIRHIDENSRTGGAESSTIVLECKVIPMDGGTNQIRPTGFRCP